MVSKGILNEVYYPTVNRQIRDLQYLITDGETFFRDERHLDKTHECLAQHSKKREPNEHAAHTGRQRPDDSKSSVRSVVHEALRCAPTLAITQGVTAMNMHNILYTTDFSESAKTAFGLAHSLARDHGARLIVLHVIFPLELEILNLAQLGYGENSREYEEDIMRDLQSLKPLDDGVPVEYKIAHGDPGATILQVAEEMDCDLIVLGTHGRTGLKKLLMGSVAEHVMRGALCPVLVVKGQGSAQATLEPDPEAPRP